MFDPEAMHRAVLNIVTNAIDACHERENGRVEVSTQYSHDERMARVARRRQRQRHREGRPRKDLRRVRLAQRRPRHGPRPAGEPENSAKSTAAGFASKASSARAAASRSNSPPRRPTAVRSTRPRRSAAARRSISRRITLPRLRRRLRRRSTCRTCRERYDNLSAAFQAQRHKDRQRQQQQSAAGLGHDAHAARSGRFAKVRLPE